MSEPITFLPERKIINNSKRLFSIWHIKIQVINKDAKKGPH